MKEQQGGIKQHEADRKISRSGTHLLHIERSLERNRLLEGNGAMVKSSLHLLYLQTLLKTAGTSERLLLSLYTALIGSSAEGSAAAFIGKEMASIQKAFLTGMTTDLGHYNPGLKALLEASLTMVGAGIIYLISIVLGQWSEKFQGYNKTLSRSSGPLFRELSILFIIASGVLYGIFDIIASAVKVPEADRKAFIDIGQLYALVMILYASEDDSKSDDLWSSLLPFFKKLFPSLEKNLTSVADKHTVDAKEVETAQSYMQGVKGALDHDDAEALKRVIEEVSSAMGLSKDAFLEDLKRVKAWAIQIEQNLGSAASEAGKTTTHIIQST